MHADAEVRAAQQQRVVCGKGCRIINVMNSGSEYVIKRVRNGKGGRGEEVVLAVSAR